MRVIDLADGGIVVRDPIHILVFEEQLVQLRRLS